VAAVPCTDCGTTLIPHCTSEFEVAFDDDEVISDAVVILRVTRLGDGRNTVALAKSDGADAVTTTGLIECARQINQGDWRSVDEDE